MKNRVLSKILATVLLGAVLLTGCGMNKDKTLVNINNGKDSITLGYGNFMARYTQAMYDGNYLQFMGEQMWSQENEGVTMEASVKKNVLESIKEQYALKQHAKEYGVKVTSEEKKAITKAATKFMKENDSDTIKALGATQDIVEEFLTNQTIATKMMAAIKDEVDLTADEKKAEDDETKQKVEEKQDKHYEKVVKPWKKDITWKVDKKAWEEVKFDSLFKAKEAK